MFRGVYVLIAGVPLLLLLAARRSSSGIDRGRVRLEFAFGLYLLIVLVLVLFPLRVSPALRADDAVWDYAAFIRDWTNFVPFASIGQLLERSSPTQVVRQLGGNLLLLAPFGALAPVLFRRLRRPGAMVAAALVSSLGIEALQYLGRVMRLSLRSVDIDDAMLNFAGAMLGFLVWSLWRRAAARASSDGGAGGGQ